MNESILFIRVSIVFIYAFPHSFFAHTPYSYPKDHQRTVLLCHSSHGQIFGRLHLMEDRKRKPVFNGIVFARAHANWIEPITELISNESTDQVVIITQLLLSFWCFVPSGDPYEWPLPFVPLPFWTRSMTGMQSALFFPTKSPAICAYSEYACCPVASFSVGENTSMPLEMQKQLVRPASIPNASELDPFGCLRIQEK